MLCRSNATNRRHVRRSAGPPESPCAVPRRPAEAKGCGKGAKAASAGPGPRARINYGLKAQPKGAAAPKVGCGGKDLRVGERASKGNRRPCARGGGLRGEGQRQRVGGKGMAQPSTDDARWRNFPRRVATQRAVACRTQPSPHRPAGIGAGSLSRRPPAAPVTDGDPRRAVHRKPVAPAAKVGDELPEGIEPGLRALGIGAVPSSAAGGRGGSNLGHWSKLMGRSRAASVIGSVAGGQALAVRAAMSCSCDAVRRAVKAVLGSVG